MPFEQATKKPAWPVCSGLRRFLASTVDGNDVLDVYGHKPVKAVETRGAGAEGSDVVSA